MLLGGSRMLEHMEVGAEDSKISRNGSAQEALISRVNGLFDRPHEFSSVCNVLKRNATNISIFYVSQSAVIHATGSLCQVVSPQISLDNSMSAAKMLQVALKHSYSRTHLRIRQRRATQRWMLCCRLLTYSMREGSKMSSPLWKRAIMQGIEQMIQRRQGD